MRNSPFVTGDRVVHEDGNAGRVTATTPNEILVVFDDYPGFTERFIETYPGFFTSNDHPDNPSRLIRVPTVLPSS